MTDLINRLMKELTGELDAASAMDPDHAEAALTLPTGRLQTLAYRRGLSDPSRAWEGSITWAGLIVYPAEEAPEAYLIPAADFPETDGYRGVLQRVDWISVTEPGVLWIDLADDAVFAARRTWLRDYRLC